MTAAHLGDGGEGLLVLRPGDGQQRVGHRDQACRSIVCCVCHIIITESVLPVDTAFQNIAKFSAEGWKLRFCTLFWAKLSCFIIHTILRTTIYKPRKETAKSFIFSNRGDTQKAEQEDGSRLLKHRKIGRVQKIKMLFSLDIVFHT